jgi:hypothetical protein
MNYTLIDLETVLRKIERGSVWYHHDGDDTTVGDPAVWDGASNLFLAQLGDTEGDINLTANTEVANLTLPEISGTAIHEATYVGDNPTIEVPLFLADPDLLSVVSPTGLQSAGHFRVRDVAERTVVVFPERLFRDAAQVYQQLVFTGGVWTLNALALTAAQVVLMQRSVWFWRCYMERPPLRFLGGHGDEGKNIEPTMIHAMMASTVPDGERLFTIGDPALVTPTAIDIEGGS